MRNISDVLAQKKKQQELIQREIEALELVIAMLEHEEVQPIAVDPNAKQSNHMARRTWP